MTTADDKDEIFELRFYNVAANRDGDMRTRVQNDLKWLFPRHGVRPVGGWSAISAPSLPMFVYLAPWRNMMVRNKCWGGFYSDPDWQEVRNRTNAGSELVADYEIWFLRAISDWTGFDMAATGVHEIVFLKTMVGKSVAAAEALRTSEIPALERAGAKHVASFDVMSGGLMPASVSFLTWPDPLARLSSAQALENDRELAAARQEQKAQFGDTLVGRRGSYLLDPVQVDWDD